MASVLRRLFGLPARARRYLTVGVDDRITETSRKVDDAIAVAREASRKADEVIERERQIQQGLDRLAKLVEESATRQRAHEEKAVRSEFAILRRQIEGVHGSLAGRLDEVSVKIRPVLPFDARSTVVRLRDGALFVPASEAALLLMLSAAPADGLEPGAARTLRRLLQPGDTAVDVGANLGMLVVPAAAAVGSEGRIFAFEPDPHPRAQLEKTLWFNGLRQVTVDPRAVGAAAATARLHVSSIIGHTSLVDLPEEERAPEAEIDVEVTTLDAAIPEGTEVAVAKIDVEGFELEALRGMSRVLRDSPDLALVAEFGPSHLNRVGVTPEAWLTEFDDRGFTPYAIGEPDGTLVPALLEDLVKSDSTNLLFVRPGSRPADRLGLEPPSRHWSGL